MRLKFKQIFSFKRILKIFISIFIILFFAGGCSFKYMDWQYYKFRSLAEKESGFYVADPKFFDEIQQENFKRSRKLANGYGIESEETADLTMINNRIYEYRLAKMYFIDSLNKKHIISYYRVFRYIEYGLWLGGDEGAGFYWKNRRYIEFVLADNIFYYNKENDSFIKGKWTEKGEWRADK